MAVWSVMQGVLCGCGQWGGWGGGKEVGPDPHAMSGVGAAAGLHQTELAGKTGGVCAFTLGLCDQSSF